jgi:hypothetical protein
MSGYREVPPWVKVAIDECGSDQFYVGTTKTYAVSDLRAGVLSHLNVSVGQGGVEAAGAALPPEITGRWSRWNIHGRRIRRADLPKVTKSWGWTGPVFGDWSKGSVYITQSREVFQWQVIYGQGLPILVDVGEAVDGSVAIGFRVDRVFDRAAGYEERDVLLALSLLRENVGKVAIVSANLTVEDWLADQDVDWEILPVGQRGSAEDALDRIAKKFRIDPGGTRMKTIRDRHAAISGLHPVAVVLGQGKFTRYFGYKFRDNLVALENLDYGNALYLMYEDWPILSQRTRLELLAEPDANYDRIIHRNGWETRLRDLLLLKGHDPNGAAEGPA